MPLWLLIGTTLLPVAVQLLSGLARRGQQRPRQAQGERVIRLPQRPITEEDIRQTLILTRDLFERARQTGGLSGQAQDLTKGVLREAQKLAEESAAIRGYSGGLATRAVTETLGAYIPSLAQAQQAFETQALQNVLNELVTMAGLSGRIGGVLTPQMLQFIGGLAATEAGLTGMYNPPFHYGLYSPVEYARHTQGQLMWDNFWKILQWLGMFLPLLKK